MTPFAVLIPGCLASLTTCRLSEPRTWEKMTMESPPRPWFTAKICICHADLALGHIPWISITKRTGSKRSHLGRIVRQAINIYAMGDKVSTQALESKARRLLFFDIVLE